MVFTSIATGGTGYVGGLIAYACKTHPLKVKGVARIGLDINFIGTSSKAGSFTGSFQVNIWDGIHTSTAPHSEYVSDIKTIILVLKESERPTQ